MIIHKEEVWQPALPDGFYFYKTKNNKKIFKSRYTDEYIIVYRLINQKYMVEHHKGECSC